MIMQSRIDQYAKMLLDAEKAPKQAPAVLITDMFPQIETEDAYAVAECYVSMKSEEDKKVYGYKIGLTSPMVQQILGAGEPAYGILTKSMILSGSRELLMKNMYGPKIEGELSFILKKELSGPGVTETDVLDATESICASIEVIDSRYGSWQMKLQDMIADNGSAAYCVLGDSMCDPGLINMKHTSMAVFRNGEKMAEGTTEAVLGSPAHSVAVLANMLGKKGISLKPGQVIMSGAPVPALEVAQGDEIEVRFEGVGKVSVRFL